MALNGSHDSNQTDSRLESRPRSLKTLSRKNDEFLAYLEGTFSRTQMALPIRSMNVGTQTEEITFEIVDDADLVKPSTLRIAQALIRPSSLILSAGPMLTVLARAIWRMRDINWFLALSCFVGVTAFQIATNLFNDYGDHMKGQDRIRPKGGSRAIQSGWVRAKTVKQTALGVTGFAILCGITAVFRSPALIAAGLALLFTLEFAFQRLRLKARGWAEGLAFLLTGPLLTTGYAWATTGGVEVADISLGCVFGFISLLYFHSANFENIMIDSQAGARTWATRAGFDASKTFYYVVALACLLATAVQTLALDLRAVIAGTLGYQLAQLSFAVARVRRIASPLSSELIGLRTTAIIMAWATTAFLLIGYLYLGRG